MAHAQKAEEALRREQSRILAQPKADGAVAPHAQHHLDQAQRTVSDVRDAIIRQKAEIAEHAVQTATLARRNLAEARGPAASGWGVPMATDIAEWIGNIRDAHSDLPLPEGVGRLIGMKKKLDL